MRGMLLGLLLSCAATAATAQTLVVPLVGNTPVSSSNSLPTNIATTATYSAGIASYTGYASPTDIVSIKGSATKTIKIINIRLSGYATADDNFGVALVKRSTADTGGTPTTATATPHNSTSAAATATVVSYAAAPTLGTLVGAFCACQLQVPAKNGTGGGVLEWQFNRNGGESVVLHGTSEMVALNLYGVSLGGGTNLNITIEWLEE